MTSQFDLQVEPEHYDGARYDCKERFLSYHRQIELVLENDPASLLEVGIGNGFVHRYLRNLGLQVHTVDADGRLNPDTTASVLHLPFEDASFDVVCCFETLEHLPWNSFASALQELRRVAKRRVLLSLPDVTPYFLLLVERGVRKDKLLRFRDVPNLRAEEHVFDGEHYWEIGKRRYPLSRIKREIESTGLRILQVTRSYDNTYHRYFCLSKAVGLWGR